MTAQVGGWRGIAPLTIYQGNMPKWFKFRPEYDNHMKIKIKETLFGRFILIRADNPFQGWSGSRWVPVNPMGHPDGDTQVSNLATYKDAILYAEKFGFEVEV